MKRSGRFTSSSWCEWTDSGDGQFQTAERDRREWGDSRTREAKRIRLDLNHAETVLLAPLRGLRLV